MDKDSALKPLLQKEPTKRSGLILEDNVSAKENLALNTEPKVLLDDIEINQVKVDNTAITKPHPTQTSIPMTDQHSTIQTPREMIRHHTYPVLAAISTLSLVFGVANLVPVAKWAKSQNICIEVGHQSNDGNIKVLSENVAHCNGGHD